MPWPGLRDAVLIAALALAAAPALAEDRPVDRAFAAFIDICIEDGPLFRLDEERRARHGLGPGDGPGHAVSADGVLMVRIQDVGTDASGSAARSCGVWYRGGHLEALRDALSRAIDNENFSHTRWAKTGKSWAPTMAITLTFHDRDLGGSIFAIPADQVSDRNGLLFTVAAHVMDRWREPRPE